MERSPQERGAFLAQACRGDPGLLAQIETLLASHGTAGAFLESEARPREVRALDEVAEDRLLEPALCRIGPYQILRELGHGGMGAVYLAARADEAYRKEVAIKVIRRGTDTEFVVARARSPTTPRCSSTS